MHGTCTTQRGLTLALGPAPVVCGRVGVVGLLCWGVRGARLRWGKHGGQRSSDDTRLRPDSASPRRMQVR